MENRTLIMKLCYFTGCNSQSCSEGGRGEGEGSWQVFRAGQWALSPDHPAWCHRVPNPLSVSKVVLKYKTFYV